MAAGFTRPGWGRQEALLVAQLLEEAGWDVTRVIPSGPTDTALGPDDIVNALFAADYRLVHVAAHGHYDSLNLVNSGVVIGDRRFLTPLEFSAMSTVPDLVFLNCCHLGRLDDAEPENRRAGAWGNFHHLAASVSRQLIGNGSVRSTSAPCQSNVSNTRGVRSVGRVAAEVDASQARTREFRSVESSRRVRSFGATLAQATGRFRRSVSWRTGLRFGRGGPM